jgi:prephenate dehydrogenase
MAQFRQITIVGLGLIGGSIGMAARRRRLAGRVVGLSRSAATVRRAKRRGAIDAGTTNPREAVRDADLVILAGPVDAIVPTGTRLAGFMKPGSVLTDVGSTKADIVAALERSLPRGVLFVGGHPIAGSERRGIEAASAALFSGATCVLTPTSRTPAAASRAATRLWQGLGMRVARMRPIVHDCLLGFTSHLPHALAFCLAADAPRSPIPMPRSWLEMTRIAKSDPELWDDILLSNRKAVALALDRFIGEAGALSAALKRGNRPAVLGLLRRAKRMRDAVRDE